MRVGAIFFSETSPDQNRRSKIRLNNRNMIENMVQPGFRTLALNSGQPTLEQTPNQNIANNILLLFGKNTFNLRLLFFTKKPFNMLMKQYF